MSTTTHILGAGSIGLLLAARLSAAADVVLIRRSGDWPPRLDLTLQEDDRQQQLSLPQVSPEQLDHPIDRLIVCTKAYDALPAIQSLGSRLETGATLLLMQNGMGSQQTVAVAFPRASVYAASSTEGAFRPAAGHVVHAGRGITRIGRLQGSEHDWVSLFQAAGLAAELAEPIEWHLANKLRINALINPLTVLHGCRNGELLERPTALAMMRTLGTEADAVLAAAGYRFDQPAFDVAAEVARRTAANVSSMLQDARAGRRLEIDAITGYLLALSVQTAVPAPTHQAVLERLRAFSG